MYISDEDYKKLMEIAASYSKVQKTQKKYREANRDKVNQRINDWRLRNPEKFNAIQKRYKDKKKQIDNKKNDVKIDNKGE